MTKRKTLTEAETIRLEASTTDRGARFAINYARNQYGRRVGREVATLIASGVEVAVAQGAAGFFVRGSFVPVTFKNGRWTFNETRTVAVGDAVRVRAGCVGAGYRFVVVGKGTSGHGEPIVYGSGNYGPVREAEVEVLS